MSSSSAGSGSLPNGQSGLNLSPDQIGDLFPFRVVFDRNMTVQQVGPSMRKLLPALEAGADITEQWVLVSPLIPFTADAIRSHLRSLFIVMAKEGGLRLRGQMLTLPGESIAFVGSPWLPETGQFRATGLTFDDFAIHDSMPEFVQVVQAQRFGMDDLRKLTDKLRQQSASLKQANQKLLVQAEEFQKLAMIAARTDNSVVITDASGKIEWVNEGFVRASGFTADEVLGKQPGTILYGPKTDGVVLAQMRERLRRGEGFKGELLTYCKDGRKRWVAIEVQPIRDESRHITNFMAMDRDITARKEADFRKALAFSVSTILAESVETTAALQKILQTIVEAMGYRFSVVWRLNSGGSGMYPHSIWSPRELRNSHFEQATRALVLRPGTGLPGLVWEANEPRWMPDLAKEPAFVRIEAALRDHLLSGFAFPIRVGGQPCGVMEFYSATNEKPDDELMNTLTTLGNQIGQFMEHHDAEMERRRLVSLLHSTLESTKDGILVTDLRGRFLMWNQPFGKRFAEDSDGRKPAVLMDHRESLRFATEHFTDGTDAEARLSWWYEHPYESGDDLIHSKDGRVIERTTQPQRDSTGVIGRVWSFRDVTARWQTEQALRESEERYRVISSSASDAIIVVNRVNAILFANEAAHRIFSYPQGELVGLNLNRLMAASFKNLDARGLLRVVRGASGIGGPKATEIMGLRRNGEEFPLEITFGRSHIRGERVMTGVMRDITERRQVEEDRRRAMREIEKANRAKSDFLATISHEIRTPLNSIAGLTGLLRETQLDDDQRNMLDTIWAASESLLHLINDLLDISKVEAGQVDIVVGRFDPAKVCERALEIVKTKARQKGLALVCTIEPPSPPPFLGDANRIGQILMNLLSNGVKFTERGSVSLHLRWSVTDENSAEVEFLVRDSGIGIGSQDSTRVFDKFYRIDSPVGRQAGGTGLGLSISRSLAAEMGGSLTLSPEEPHGSRFTLLLRLPFVSTPAPETGAETGGVALLLADPGRSELLRQAWSSVGLHVVVFENPTAAANWLDADGGASALGGAPERPGVVVLIEDGLNLDPAELERFFRILARRGKVRCIRIQTPDSAGKPGALPAGVTESIDYPLTPARMKNALRRVTRENMEKPFATGSGEAAPVGHSEPSSRVLLVEDNPDSAAYARRVFQKAGHRVTLAASVAEAVEQARNERFDVIFMDVMLPDGNGFDATKKIREHEQSQHLPHVPVVALTAHALLEYREQAYVAEMDDYLSKPVRQEALLGAVKKWSRALPSVVIAPETSPPVASGDLVHVDADIADLIPPYLHSVKASLDSVRDLVKQGKDTEIRKIGHNLKGTGTTYGFEEVSRLGSVIETCAKNGDIAAAGDAALTLRAYLENIRWDAG